LHLDSPSKLQDHYEVDHPYCSSCNKVFKNDLGLHEHNRQKPEHADLYCVACRKLFRAPHSLRSVSFTPFNLDRAKPDPDKLALFEL
jgi:hypothetical protein